MKAEGKHVLDVVVNTHTDEGVATWKFLQRFVGVY